MYYSFFISSSIDGHLGCFHVLAIVNSTAISNEYCIFLNCDFLRVPSSEIAWSTNKILQVSNTHAEKVIM